MAILEDPYTTWIAFVCTWVSNVLTVYLICRHIANYTQPQFQRYICRIVFIVPFYCTASWLALHHREQSIFFETPRDCYEAWVIYNFMALCMAYVGGPGAVVVKSEGVMIQPSWALCTCCMKPIPVDGFFLRNCKQGTLQFVIIKPPLAIITLILFSMDLYQVGDWSISGGYFYEALIYNICYSLALFWMLLFYVGTHDLLMPYKPLLKFFVFKTVIFLTFWQGLAVTFLATRFGWSPEDSEALQNWLICVEMLFAALGMFFAFPHEEYQLGGAASPGFSWESFKHAVSISDVIEDIMYQFNPGYKAYVLHSDGGPSENVKRKKFRGKKKKKPAFTALHVELGKLGTNITKIAKFKPRAVPGPGDVESADGVWHSAIRKDNILKDINHELKGLVDKTKQQKLVSWMVPRITEMERKQAELLDSDSDAGYDSDNHGDNQLDGAVLATSSDEDSDTGLFKREETGNGLEGEGSDAEARKQGYEHPDGNRSDSEVDVEETGTEGGSGKKPGEWEDVPLEEAAAGSSSKHRRRKTKSKRKGRDDDWVRFPRALPPPLTASYDTAWADFDAANGSPSLSRQQRQLHEQNLLHDSPLMGSPFSQGTHLNDGSQLDYNSVEGTPAAVKQHDSDQHGQHTEEGSAGTRTPVQHRLSRKLLQESQHHHQSDAHVIQITAEATQHAHSEQVDQVPSAQVTSQGC